jgi:hypothetical protein
MWFEDIIRNRVTDPTIKAKIKQLLEQAGLPKTVIGKGAGLIANFSLKLGAPIPLVTD